MVRATVILLVALVSGCGGETATPPLDATLGGFTVHVEASPARLVVTDGQGNVLLDGLPGASVPPGEAAVARAAAAFRHADATYEFQAGAFKIEERGGDWRGVTEFVDAEVTPGGTSVSFGLVDAEGTRLGDAVITPGSGEGELAITVTAIDPAHDRVSMAFACDAGEHFQGFGGQSWDVDHRGQTVPLWVQEDGIGKAPEDFYDFGVWFLVGRRHSTHTPIPMYLSSRGYGLFLDTPFRSVFAMCSEAEDMVRVEAWEPALRLHLFAGPAPRDVVRRFTALVGRPRLPPVFAFAPWNDAIFGSDNVRRVAGALRSADIPSSVIWTEDWRGGSDTGTGYALDEDWNVDRALYPDFEAVATDLHAAGYKLLTYENTFVTSGVDIFAEAVAGGYTIQREGGGPYLFSGTTFADTSLVDLSNPAAWQWTKSVYRDGLALGADGYMADFAEWLPADAVLASGESALAAHNHYPVEYQRLNRELFDELAAGDGVERLFFVRSAYVGSQPLVSVVWAGDQQTDFSEGDGLPSVIPMGIGLGITGFPYFGHDIGGYMSQFTVPTSRELFFRWTTLGALSPVMRTHHGRSARDNWTWEGDAATTAHFRAAAKLHMQLFPYLQAHAVDAATTGAPMLRSLAFEWPQVETAWMLTDEFLLGDRLLAAPVVSEGATARSVFFPPGAWIAWDGGARHDAPAEGMSVDVPVALDGIPLFVAGGTVLVLLPERVDTLVSADPAGGVVTLSDVADDREIWLYDGGDSSFTEVGGLAYSWIGDGASPAVSATWNGVDVPIAGGSVTVTGSGTLVVNGTATLTVDGGAADRELLVRVR